MKRLISLLLVAVMCVLSLGIPVSAATSETQAAELQQADTYNIVTVQINGQPLEVPAVRNFASASSNADGTVSVTETIFVPDMNSEEAVHTNTQVVSEIKAYGSPRSRGYGDFYVSGYIWFHSTLNYSTSNVNGFTYFDLISFKLEREVYTMSPFNNLNDANAKVTQVGDTYGDATPGEELSQEKDYGTISYDTLYSVPADWDPVTYVGHDIGVRYSVYIDFSNQADYWLEYTHKAV